MKATPDSLLVLLPWIDATIDVALLKETHAHIWAETIDVVETDDTIVLQQVNEQVTLWIGEQDDTLTAAMPFAPEPFVGSEKLRVETHTHVIHLIANGEPTYPTALMTKLVSTFVEMGSAAIFIPMTGRIFPQRWVQRATMTPDLQATVQIFINAWDDDTTMRTRGLTAFGLPELQLAITEGKNAAFFDLLDISAFMIDRGVAVEVGERVQVGAKFYKAYAVESPTDDPLVPIAGTFGVLELRTR